MSREMSSRKIKVSHSDAVYGMGLFGAMVYYIGNASSFGQGVLGFLKAFFWPGFLVHKLLEFLKA